MCLEAFVLFCARDLITSLQYPLIQELSMTKRLPLVIVLILFLTSLAYAQESTPSPSPAPKPAMSRAQSQRIIIATEKKLWEAWKTKDSKPFKANLSADSIMIGDEGVADKTTAI